MEAVPECNYPKLMPTWIQITSSVTTVSTTQKREVESEGDGEKVKTDGDTNWNGNRN